MPNSDLYTKKELIQLQMKQEVYCALQLSASKQLSSEIDMDASSTNFGCGKFDQSDLIFESWLDQILSSPFEQDSPFPQAALPKKLPNPVADKKIKGQIDDQSFSNLGVSGSMGDDKEFIVDFEKCSIMSQKQNLVEEMKDDYQFEVEHQQNNQSETKQSKAKPKQRGCADTRSKKLKNFLSCVKRCILLLEEEKLLLIQNEDVQAFIKSEKMATKVLFEKIFKSQEARVVMARIFGCRELNRQLQLSVMNEKNRKLYLSELSLLKKALVCGRLSNL